MPPEWPCCYVFFSPRSLDLPSSLLTKTPKDSSTLYHPCLTLAPALSQSSSRPYPRTLLSMPTPPLLTPFPILPSTPLNTELLRSMDLPWISPGSPLRLTDTRLRVFPCFPSLTSLVCFTYISAPLLLSHLASPYLASIFDPLYHH